MSKNTKIIVIVGVVLLIPAIAFFLWQYWNDFFGKKRAQNPKKSTADKAFNDCLKYGYHVKRVKAKKGKGMVVVYPDVKKNPGLKQFKRSPLPKKFDLDGEDGTVADNFKTALKEGKCKCLGEWEQRCGDTKTKTGGKTFKETNGQGCKIMLKRKKKDCAEGDDEE